MLLVCPHGSPTISAQQETGPADLLKPFPNKLLLTLATAAAASGSRC